MAESDRTRKNPPKPDRLPMSSWAFALAPETIAASIHQAHVDWLAAAAPGSRLVRHDDDGEVGHVYPDTTRTPEGWTLLATKRPGGDA